MARVFILLGCWLVCSLARADVFVIAPPYFEGTDGERVSTEIVRVVADDLAAAQHKVFGPKEAASRVSKEQRVWCKQGACAEHYRAALGAAAAIVVRVARVSSDGPATSFQLGIQPAPGLEYTAGGLLAEGPLGERVVKALREAFRAYRQGPGPWLEVSGAPEGAAVFVNDVAVGTLPCTVAVPVGAVRVRVEARSFVPKTDVVAMQSAADRRKLVLRLEPQSVLVAPAVGPEAARPVHVPEAPAALPETDARRRWRGLLYGGLGAAAVGAVVGTVGVVHKVREGRCSSEGDAGCLQRHEFGAVSRFALGGGVSLTLLGATLAAVGGWKLNTTARVQLAASPSAVALSVGGEL
jgi:PEGA domain